MSVYNKTGGGVNKVLIDNKPPSERLNLTEVESIVRNRVVELGGWQILARQKNEYIITASRESAILKGNPYSTWTQILSLKNTPFNGAIRAVIHNVDDSLTFITTSDASLFTYKLTNGLVTLVKVLTIVGEIVNLFVLNDNIYIYTIQNYNYRLYRNKIGTETLTEITNNINFEDGTNISFIGAYYSGTTYKNQRYQARYSPTYKKVEIVEFNGERIRIVKVIDTDFEIYNVYPEQFIGCNSDEIYFSILSNDISTASAIKRKYKLIDKELNVVQDGESIYPMENSFIINNVYITKEIADNYENTMVEFPIKAYVRRE